MKEKILLVFGTRPEAIKMIPLYKEFKRNVEKFEVKICVTGQHREMLDSVMAFFNIVPDFDLNLMQPNQLLEELVSKIIIGTSAVYETYKPNYVFVHGDTITCMGAAFAAFLKKVKVCHVEAGLRTYNRYSPFPEEMNRQLVSRLTDIHFAPTLASEENLLRENIDKSNIIVTGNTVIDALFDGISIINEETFVHPEIEELKRNIHREDLILVTGHRRENFGDGFKNICLALKEIALLHPQVQIIYPVHLNPNVKNIVYELLSETENISLVAPLGYPAFLWLMNKSKIIITDSGGVQEEAPSLGKPVLVMRDNTERPEAVEAGTVFLVGTDIRKIVSATTKLLNDELYYNSFLDKQNPYGDGKAAERIVNYFK